MAAKALLDQNPSPSEAEIRAALEGNSVPLRHARSHLACDQNLCCEWSGPATAAAPRKLPGSLETNLRLDRWLTFNADGTVTVCPGKVEIGQGILTALVQIVAEELDVRASRIRPVPAATTLSPDEGVTSGSRSIQESGIALRFAAAEARGFLDSPRGGQARRFGRATLRR